MKGLKNNTLSGIWEWFTGQLSYEPNETKAIGRLIFEHFLGVTATDFIAKKDLRFSESQIVSIHKAIRKLQNNIPVQHITGISYFRDLTLKVNKHVLIPRPETEELVQWILDDTYQNKDTSLQIWDIGTGSGAIAISLAKELNKVMKVEVRASDISLEALQTAIENAKFNNTKVDFFHHDILNDTLPDQKYDCIISNPPYVKESEKALMQANVLDHEPHTALFVPEDNPLLFYKAIATIAKQKLRPGGSLYVEINEALGEKTTELFAGKGFVSLQLRRDIHSKNRFVKGVAP